MGVIRIAINEKETVEIQVPEYIEAAYLILHDSKLSEAEQFSRMLDVLGVNSIQFKKKLRNLEIQKEYLNIIDLIRAAGNKPVKSIIRRSLCKKYKLKSRQLIKILKK